MAAEKKTSPNVESRLRHNILKMPQEVYAASGIVINGRRLKSFVFTTDLAIIRNCDADAVFAVYPFTPQQAISDAIIKASYIPVFCGVGGGTTHGVRTLNLARDVESQGLGKTHEAYSTMKAAYQKADSLTPPPAPAQREARPRRSVSSGRG